ncbi:MAG: carbonate dehydratase [Gemmatimonadaceae bacterium]
MASLEHLFANNRAWAAAVTRRDPGFFDRLSRQQKPRYLCSDSRVPANEIVGLLPGELFVHRNVANVVVRGDLNCLSVIQYAVDVLGVEHIIVCGHYGCGGVKAALFDEVLGLVDNWVKHVRDVKKRHSLELKALASDNQLDRLCELNVIEQVLNTAQTSIVQDAWARGQLLAVHGWIYGLRDGLLKELAAGVTSPFELARLRR